MDEDELKRHTKLFGLRIVKLIAALPRKRKQTRASSGLR
jgi:hypothetical protein